MRRLALVALAGGLLGCQDYRFNPVGRCTLQPGQARVNVSDVTTADVLFVVDDSGSMDPFQGNLSTNFDAFITRLVQLQKDRTDAGKQPFDFYIAVTTSSVLLNDTSGQVCTGGVCNVTAPTDLPPYSYACSPAGSACGDVQIDFHYGGGCTQGLAPASGQPYFAGDFVRSGSNPRVIDFVKTLGWSTWNGTTSTDTNLNNRVTWFKQNIQVGSCGSGQEMHLEGGRRALQKALAGSALNTGFLHAGAKLVVVWVGNEDDCSSPAANQGGFVLTGSPGADACTTESAKASGSKLTPVSDYTAFFSGLGRPLGAAFIRPGSDLPNAGGSCACAGGSCTAYTQGPRFKAMADGFRNLGASVVEGSVCDPNFGATLTAVADLVKPVSSLHLPSTPAAGIVTQLRVLDGSGRTVHTCAGPSDPAPEWHFVNCATGATSAAPTSCVAIVQSSACEPQSGQTLVALYLGQVPPGGCATAADCTVLGGSASDWTCDMTGGGSRGTCLCSGS